MKRSDILSRRIMLLGMLGTPLLAACGGRGDETGEDLVGGTGDGGAGREHGGMRLVAASDVDRTVPPPDAPLGPTVDGITAFGHHLVRAVRTPTGNAVVSPLSIAYAFGMVRAGAKGSTAEQIDEVLGFPGSGTHAALNALARDIVTTDTAPPRRSAAPRKPGTPASPPVVTIANGLFAQTGFEIHPEFLRTLAAEYGAGVHTLDLHAPGGLDLLNDWVAQHTAGRIRKLFEQLDPMVVLVLANAVYLKADWRTPFEQSDTRAETFTRADGRRVTVPMMTRTGRLRYATGDGWRAVELPYAGDALAMWVLVPDVPATDAPVRLLDPAVLRTVADGLTEGYVEVAMPRWDFATQLELNAVLRRLGMELPWTRAADFSGITARPLWIDEAVHRATITVDEWGTEAAAVTGVAMRTTSMPPPPAVTIRADRPFAFAIVHRPSAAPLFVGEVGDPLTES